MTRKEANQILHCPDTVGGVYSEKYGQALDIAMKALEQEPCEDAVSRAEALKGYIEVGRADGVEIYSEKAVPTEYINNLPPITPTRKEWIPVSEDSPKDAYGCIVTVMDVDLKTQNEFENILPYFVGYDGETWNNADVEPTPYEVIAWMKAPEPYKAESEDSDGKN